MSLLGFRHAGDLVPAQNYTCELLNLQPFPAFGGNSSRLLGEVMGLKSNLYWLGWRMRRVNPPVVLNRLFLEGNHMVADIFATDIEDGPALIRAMIETGEEFRQGKIALPQQVKASPPSQESGAQQEQSQVSSTAGGHK